MPDGVGVGVEKVEIELGDPAVLLVRAPSPAQNLAQAAQNIARVGITTGAVPCCFS